MRIIESGVYFSNHTATGFRKDLSMEWEKLEVIEEFLRKKFPTSGIILRNSFQEPYFEIQYNSELYVLTVTFDFLHHTSAEEISGKFEDWDVVRSLEENRGLSVLITSEGAELTGRAYRLPA